MNTLEEIIEALKFHTPPISCEAKYMFKYMTQERELTDKCTASKSRTNK